MRIIVVWLAVFTLFTPTDVAEAGPFSDFFRKVRYAMAHPEKKSRSHRSSRKKDNEGASSDAPSSSAPSAAVSAPPNKQNTRMAKAASAKKEEKSSLRYGTPVPGRQGLVTSPFAPESGYIDVSNFPPGTEVRDPYTGKIFRTP